MRRFLDALCGVPTDHPWATLLAAIVLTLLSVAGIKRLSADASLDAMFPQGDAAADVLVHVLDQFGTADELLVLVTLPEDAQSPDPQRLLDYADRFQKAVADSPAGPLSDGVVYRVEPDIIQFVQHELAPAGLFYLDNQTLAQVMDRLSPDGMRRQLDHDQAMLAQPGPAAGAMAKALMQDPLALHDFLLPKLREAEPMGTYQNSDALIAPDGKSLLIRVLGKKPPTDLPYSRALSAAIVDACRSAQPRGLNVQFSGAYAIAAASERSIRRDAITSIVSSVALLMALFLVAFRRPLRLFHLAFAPVALGVLWGFGIYGLVLRNLSPVAAVIGGVLAGMGIDYSVLFLSRYESVRGELGSRAAARTTLRETAPAVFAAWITSVAGFLAIGWSTVKALRDFSILGTVGLAGSFLGAAFVVPALLSIAGGDDLVQRRAFRFSLEPMQRWADRHRGFSVGSCVLLMLVSTVVAAWPGPSLFEAESDLTVMHPRPNPALDTELEIARRFGTAPGSMLIYLKAADSQSLAALAHEVQNRLSTPGVRDAGVSGTLSLANWLPDPAIVAARQAQISQARADRIVADFKSALADSAFQINAFGPYETFLHELFTRSTAPTLAALQKYPGLMRNLLPKDFSSNPTEAVTIVFLSHRTEDRQARDAAIAAVAKSLQGLQGATLSGLAVVSHDVESAVRTELPRLLTAACVLVAVYLLIHFRGAKEMILSLLPALFGLTTLAAIVRLSGIHLNMINLVAVPLLVGIDVDYGIYLVSLARIRGDPGKSQPAIDVAGRAILVCASAMIIGYASLQSTSVPAVRSLGIVVAVGVSTCLLGSYFLLGPLLAKK